MAKKLKGFESYPLGTVFLTNIVTLSVYSAGVYLLYLVWPWLALLFFLFLLYNELSIYREGCVNCYYYGKRCAFGRGRIAKLLFRKGDPKKFCSRKVGFKDFMLPSLPSFIPAIAAVYLLIKDFSWIVLIIAIWPLVVLFVLNSFIFGELVCPNCRQCSICCPVAEFFMKMEKKKKK